MVNIEEKIEQEDEGTHSFVIEKINFFTVLEDELDFFILDKNEVGVAQSQIEIIRYILENTSQIEKIIFSQIDNMLASFYKDESGVDSDDMELSCIFILNDEGGACNYALCFNVSWDEHGFNILMNKESVLEWGGDYTYNGN